MRKADSYEMREKTEEGTCKGKRKRERRNKEGKERWVKLHVKENEYVEDGRG